MAPHQCAQDLFEEFVFAKVLPLRAIEAWFPVSEERYKEKRLKCPGIDVFGSLGECDEEGEEPEGRFGKHI